MSTEAQTQERVKRRKITLAGRFTRSLQAFFDTADETTSNEDLFAGAEDGTADQHANSAVRKRIRNIARYETANNGWLKGIGKTFKNDVVGTGPRIQIIDEGLSEEDRRDISLKFNRWLRDIKFAKKLRTQINCRRVDGEGIGVLFPIDEDLADSYANPVKLGYRLVDGDRLRDPNGTFYDLFESKPNYVDGVHLNRYGDAVMYDFVRDLPLGNDFSADEKPIRVKSKWVFHLFDQERAEQHRGVSELQPSLQTGGLLRQYMRSVIKAARNAAVLAGFIKTNLPPLVEETTTDDGDVETCEERCTPGDEVTLNEDTFQCLPDGYDFGQLDSKHPSQNHETFIKQTVEEIARPSCVPSNKARGSSADHNYASGRLDHQDWHKCLGIERFDLECDVLDRMFEVWFSYAILLEGYLSDEVRSLKGPNDYPPTPAHKWYWDGFEHVDPNKEAKAQTERFRNGTDHLAEAWARKGKVWSEEIECAAKSFGLTVQEYQKKLCSYLWKDASNVNASTDFDAAGIAEEIEERVAERVEEMITEISR